nr:uncharacterized protein LOC109412511 isoform X2 [Aedes albopictus]
MAGPNRGMPATHCYTQADLRPTLKDPRCNPNFPLAAYWPVYLGNFWCDVYTQRTARIQEYFGSKGLLVRMVFSRSGASDPFLKEQKRCQCYDFLVYFVSQQDAHDAVYYCNRDMYYGHRLNVLPGRTPAPFDVSKSAQHTLLQPERMQLTEQVFERYANDVLGAQISCIVRHSTEDLMVQYASVDDRNKVIRSCQIALPGPISSLPGETTLPGTERRDGNNDVDARGCRLHGHASAGQRFASIVQRTGPGCGPGLENSRKPAAG